MSNHLSSHEREKKRQYVERSDNINRGTFMPLVFSTNGMAGKKCSHSLKTLVALIVEKNVDLNYADEPSKKQVIFCAVETEYHLCARMPCILSTQSWPQVFGKVLADGHVLCLRTSWPQCNKTVSQLLLPIPMFSFNMSFCVRF